MKPETKNKLENIATYLVVGLILAGGYIAIGAQHEQVHVAIFRTYGINSYIEYTEMFPRLVTIAERPCPTEMCLLAHNINEIVGYPLIILYTIFSLLTIILLPRWLRKNPFVDEKQAHKSNLSN